MFSLSRFNSLLTLFVLLVLNIVTLTIKALSVQVRRKIVFPPLAHAGPPRRAAHYAPARFVVLRL